VSRPGLTFGFGIALFGFGGLGRFGDLGPGGRRWEGHDGNWLNKRRERERYFCGEAGEARNLCEECA
jgi:hypothetical protein